MNIIEHKGATLNRETWVWVIKAMELHIRQFFRRFLSAWCTNISKVVIVICNPHGIIQSVRKVLEPLNIY
jgi:hypothetical protein